ncbi:MAG: class I SAM-dependent methyltransferase [Bacillota bacterium]|nr:class I SAM-dependent methyltransferase [Bacillota bacterium]
MSEFALTDKGLDIAGLKKGSRILDVGCGEGDTVNHLNEQGYQAEGIDINLVKISAAKEKFPGIDVKFGDGSFLDNYMSFTFDGIMMEDTLSYINQPDEALHEAYCVMKKGGRLIIRDIYEKDPEEQKLTAVRMEASRRARIPHKEGECDEGTTERYVDFRLNGAFFKEPFIRQLEDEIGFRVMKFEDLGTDEYDAAADRHIGRFIVVAQKPI